MRPLTFALAFTTSLLLLGCGSSSGGGSASTAAGVSSQTPSGPAPSAGTGPLAQKAEVFEQLMADQHLGLGQVQDVRVDPITGVVQRLGGAPSRALWTGIYAGSQAMRYRATSDPRALDRLEDALWTLHQLHEITGLPGVIARGFDLPTIETQGFPGQGSLSQYNYNQGKTSRDQYAGWFYGIAQGFDLVQDPTLRAALEADVRAVCDKLMADDLRMRTPWGPQGTVETFFTLRPDDFYQDQINAQTWATVDDFPFNLLAKSVPYSQPLADAIKTAPIPPIRAGEGLRAVFFFTVAEHVTGDPRYAAFKRDLLHQRGYLDIMEKYGTIIDDLLYGRNMQVVEDTVRQLVLAIGHVLQAYLQATGQSAVVTQFLVPLATQGLSGWLADALVDTLDWLHDPNNQPALQRIVQRAQIAVLILSAIGQAPLAQKLQQALQQYGPHLSHQGLIDFARTVRSHLGTNLTMLPLSAMIRLETDPAVVARYRGLIDREWDYLRDDHNPIVNLLHAGYGVAAGPNDVTHSVEELFNFPTDLRMREVDNSNWPGLVVSPWPDRMGKVGEHALVPGYFPIHHRAPDIFPWRGHPRRIKSGYDDPTLHVAPLGYLSAYWLAREVGAIGPSD